MNGRTDKITPQILAVVRRHPSTNFKLGHRFARAAFLLPVMALLLMIWSPLAASAACSYCSPSGLNITCCGDVGQVSCGLTGYVNAGDTEPCSACRPGLHYDTNTSHCERPCSWGHTLTGACCGAAGQPICDVSSGFDSCKPGLYYNSSTAHCENPPSCDYGYRTDGGCCGAEGQAICPLGPAGNGFQSCDDDLIATDLLTCQDPRTIGEDCGPAFPCQDDLQCVPFAQKCAPDAGDQILDNDACLAFYDAAVHQGAKDGNVTLNFGISASGAAGVAASYEIGNVYGQDDRYGCYLTYCVGFESNAAIGESVCAGISTDYEGFGGDSFVTAQGGGAAIEFITSQGFEDEQCFLSNPAPPCLNATADCIGVGVGVVPFSAGAYDCTTIVNTVRGNNAPTAVCRGATEHTDAFSCQANADIDNGSSDPDGDTITTTQSPSGPYAVGSRSVALTVTDGAGESSTCNAQVTVIDSTPPVIAACPDITVYTGSGRTTCDQVATWTAPAASDNCGDTSVTSDRPSGATLPVGDTTVTYTARDAANETATCSFMATVVDSTPPTITCPANIAVDATSASGAVVDFSPPGVTDNCGASSTLCTAESGSALPIGTNTVTCTATDQSANQTSCSFVVKVDGPLENTKAVHSSLVALSATVTNKRDQRTLDQAISALTKAKNPVLWIDDAHPKRRQGGRVFSHLKRAVNRLGKLARKHPALAPDLQSLIDRVVLTARIVAEANLPMDLGDAQDPALIRLVRGDVKAAKNRPGAAIAFYRSAWKVVRRNR